MKNLLIATMLAVLTACAPMQTVHVPGTTEIRGWVLGFDCPEGEVRVRYILRDDPYIQVHGISTFEPTYDQCVANSRKLVLAKDDAVRLAVTQERQWSVYSVERRK